MNLDELELLREGWDFEAKLAKGREGSGELPESFWETYSAMANTDGGNIVLGLKEKKSDGSFDTQGVPNIEKVEQTLWNLLNNRQKVSVRLLDQQHVRREGLGGKNLLIVEVPRADRRQRPVYIKGNPLTGTYRRGNEGDYLCREDEIRRMMADADERPRDGEVLKNFGMEDLDAESLAQYRNLFRSNSPNHPFLTGDDHELLRQLGGWAKDRETGNEGITLAGLVVFGTQRSILDWLPHFHLDFQEHPSPGTNAPRWLDRVTLDGTWAGNVFQFYRRVYPKLVRDLKVPFRLETQDLFRRDETPVHEALREALVNALIHADYSGTTGIRVFKKTDSFEFINPGELRLPLDQIWQGGVSDCRNPSVQKMFQMIGAGEKAGSGIPKIKRAWAEQDWRKPTIVENRELNQTVLSLGLVGLYPEEVVNGLTAKLGDAFTSADENERAVLVAVAAAGSARHGDIAKVVGGHSRDLTLTLQGLVRKKMLTQDRPGRGCSYRIRDDLVSQKLSTSLQDSNATLQDNGVTLQDNGDIETAKNQIKRRVSPEVMRRKILDLCRGSYLTRKELAEAVKRSPVFLGQKYLNPMVEEGVLELRYPESRTHPNQAYRTSHPSGKKVKQ